MPRYLIAARAERDLTEIADYIAADSPGNASRFIRKLKNHFSLLAARPLIGRMRPELAAGVRSIHTGRYIIFYRVIDDGIEIARVIHSARDIKRAWPGT
jgi:toxin ParE1/3/4